jgi:hypothetical protein
MPHGFDPSKTFFGCVMRVLITQRELVHFGGSELVTVEIAKELSDRGHEVVVFSPRLGEVAKLLWPSGVRAVSRLEDIPWEPELIHGQHHLPAMAALAYFESTPAIYYSHGGKPWVEQPPLHARFQSYVVMCEWMVKRTVAQLGIEPARVTCVPNFVNMQRFSEVRIPPKKPAKALLYFANGFSSEEISQLEAGCAALGIGLDKIGGAFGNSQTRPEVFLQNYDLVFASGKSALEAMATGCAVMTLGPGQAGGLVTIDNFEKWAFTNFGPRYFTDAAQINETWLRRELENYLPDDVSKLTQKVRSERTLDNAVNRLESIYREAIRSTIPSRSSSASFAPYLERLANEADKLWFENHGVQALRDHQDAENQRILREMAKATEILPVILKKVHSVKYRKSSWRRAWTSLRRALRISGR